MKAGIHHGAAFLLLISAVLATSCVAGNVAGGDEQTVTGSSNTPSQTAISPADNKAEWQRVYSPLSSLSMAFPPEWTFSSETNPDASIGMKNERQLLSFSVIEYFKADFPDWATLAMITNVIREEALKTFGSLEHLMATELPDTIVGDGIPAMQFEVTGSMDTTAAKFIFVVAENDAEFFEILYWTTQPRFDAASETFLDILSTVEF